MPKTVSSQTTLITTTMSTIMTSNVTLNDYNSTNIINGTTEPMVGSMRDENLALVEVATLGTIFLLIVFGNCCVMLALALRRLKMTRMYYFLLHLCISDLITGFFSVLPQLAWDITYRFYGGNILCKIIKFMQILGPYLSSYVLVVTAIDRYQAICFPLSNCSWTPCRSKLMISCAWIISIIFCLPQAFIFSYQEVPGNIGVYDCWGTFPQPFGERIYVTWYAISVFFIPLIVLIFTHFYICREIWVNVSLKRKTDKRETQLNHKQTDISHKSRPNSYSTLRGSRKCLMIGIDRVIRLAVRRAPSESCTQSTVNMYENRTQTDNIDDDVQPDQSRPKHSVVTFQESSHSSSPRVNTVNRLSRAKIKTVKITVVVILCYIVCSSPFIFVQLWAYWVPSAQNSSFWTGPIITILMLLSSLNSFVNPFIYLFFNQNLAKSLLRFCCRVKFNENFIINKTNASELNSNCNDNRIDTQSSLEDESIRVHRNGNMIPLKHEFSDTDGQNNQSPSSSKSSRISTFRNRRLNNKRKDSEFDTNSVNV